MHFTTSCRDCDRNAISPLRVRKRPGTARYMEKLDRGLIAVHSGSGYFLSWRLFGTDPQDATFGFNVYKGSTKLNAAVITNATGYQDNSTGTGTYTVKPVTNGVEGAASENAMVITGSYLNIPLTQPGRNTANDCSIGDLDGDGQYEIVLKWDATNAKDNSQIRDDRAMSILRD